MHLLPSLPHLLTLLTLSTLPLTHSQKTARCAHGVHIIASPGFGTHEDRTNGYGDLGTLKDAILDAIPGSDVHLSRYPQTKDHGDGVAVGQKRVSKAVRQYVRSCPQTPIALIGYSQGAVITMDTLCGNSSPQALGFKPSTGLDAKYAKNIIATVVYGDESRITMQPYNSGTCELQKGGASASPGGIWLRSDPSTCAAFARNIRSYCDFLDPLCCVPGTTKQRHFVYPRYDMASAQYVKQKFLAR